MNETGYLSKTALNRILPPRSKVPELRQCQPVYQTIFLMKTTWFSETQIKEREISNNKNTNLFDTANRKFNRKISRKSGE